MKDRLLLLSGLLALLVGVTGLLGAATVTAGARGTMASSGKRDVPYDLRFLNEMIMHHQGAVMSSEMMIADSKRPEMRKLAQSIARSQTRQIEQMRQWRGEWYPEARGATGMTGCGRMMDMTTGPDGMMGRDMDGMFLRMMIPHHRLGVKMAEEALKSAEHQEIKDLAREIIEEQTAEIELMEGYLEKRRAGRQVGDGVSR